MNVIAGIVSGAGVLLLIVSAVGLFRLPDALARQHAATKSTTLALGLILIGVALATPSPGAWLRIGIILFLLLVTLPVAAHVLARAASRECYRASELRDAPRASGR